MNPLYFLVAERAHHRCEYCHAPESIFNTVMTTSPLLKLNSLPRNFPLDGAVRMELVEGIPIFRAASDVQARIEALLIKQQEFTLDLAEEDELDCYEEIDDYLSFVNRMIRNISISQSESVV